MRKLAISVLVGLVSASPLLGQQEPTVLRDVEYAKVDGRALTLNLSVPRSERPVPLVVYVHGGGWRQGSKERSPSAPLLRLGYAVASIDYRLSDVAKFPAQIDDCKAAIRYLRANAAKHNIDPDRIGVWGSSAGGHLVALLGTTGDDEKLEGELGNAGVSSRVHAVVDFCGPANLLTIGRQAGQAGFDGEAKNAVALLLGGPVDGRRELAELASPVSHVTKDDAPFLILHGEEDATVPVAQSEELAAALRAAGVPVTFHRVPGTGHNVALGFRKDPRLALSVARFFDEHLKGAGAAGGKGAATRGAARVKE
jgi:acetyl esterase/lipase